MNIMVSPTNFEIQFVLYLISPRTIFLPVRGHTHITEAKDSMGGWV